MTAMTNCRQCALGSRLRKTQARFVRRQPSIGKLSLFRQGRTVAPSPSTNLTPLTSSCVPASPLLMGIDWLTSTHKTLTGYCFGTSLFRFVCCWGFRAHFAIHSVATRTSRPVFGCRLSFSFFFLPDDTLDFKSNFTSKLTLPTSYSRFLSSIPFCSLPLLCLPYINGIPPTDSRADFHLSTDIYFVYYRKSAHRHLAPTFPLLDRGTTH